MTNLQLLLSVGIPSFLVLVSIALNRSDVSSLRSEMVQLRNDLGRDMTQLRTEINRDMTQLRSDLNHDMTQLRDSIHRDMISLHECVAVVEAGQE